MATKKLSKDETVARLEGKEYSPLIIRRYSVPILHWVAIISDADLSNLDKVVTDFWDTFFYSELGHGPKDTTIQDMRDLAGVLQDKVNDEFSPKVEGIAVILSADKMIVSSLYGDFMNHEQCRLELFSLLNLSTQI